MGCCYNVYGHHSLLQAQNMAWSAAHLPGKVSLRWSAALLATSLALHHHPAHSPCQLHPFEGCVIVELCNW
jgi:hypothetical protein